MQLYRIILKPFGRLYKWLASFKTGQSDLNCYIHKTIGEINIVYLHITTLHVHAACNTVQTVTYIIGVIFLYVMNKLTTGI